jgi:tRNA dimethylallyltransferase
MLAAGLIEEVENLIKQGVKRSATAMQGLGYKEIAAYLEGEMSLEAAVELLKRDTRRYAKRQFTWFKRDPRIHWINRHHHNTSQLRDEIINLLQEKHFYMSK